MKLFSLIFIMFFSAGVAIAQDEEIAVVTDFEEGISFDDYDTYNWAIPGVDEYEGDLWISLNKLRGVMIQNAIEYEMDVRDYEFERNNPDILINYHVFEEAYEGEAYGNYPFRYNEEDRATAADIEEGTLVISIIDRETGEAIWEGYASNIFQMEDSLRAEQRDIRKAVNMIMDRFGGVELTTRR